MTEFAGYYYERPGQGAAQAVETLLRPPETPLNPEQLDEVLAYEHAFFDRPISDEQSEGAPTVGRVLADAEVEDSDAPIVFAKPFLDGRITADGMPPFTHEIEVYDWFAAQARADGSKQPLIELARKSLVAYKQELGAEIAAGKTTEEIDPDIAIGRSMVFEPGRILEQFDRLQQVRHLVRAEHGALREAASEDPVAGAKRAVLEVYLAKVNGQVADYMPRLGYIQQQSLLIGDKETWGQVAARLRPGQALALAKATARAGYFTRLDYVKNGMGLRKGLGPVEHYVDGPVAGRLWELASEDAAVYRQGETPSPVYTAAEREILRATLIEPDDMVVLLSEAIRRTGKLSAHDPATGDDRYYSGRRVRASDGGWQVARNPHKDSFSVDGEPGIVLAPQNPVPLDRFLKVGGHEVTHVDQNEASTAAGRILRIASIKGRRVSMLREEGGMATERQVGFDFFGDQPSMVPEMKYARAIEALRAGEGAVTAAVYFYEELRKVSPAADPLQAAQEAADRIVRLRRNGETNSRPMVYAEPYLMSDSLRHASPEAVRRATAITCFDLPDQLRLHRYGLLPSVQAEGMSAADAFLEVMQPYIQQVLERHKS